MVSAKKRAAGKKGGRMAAQASKACKGKKGRAFHACRKAYFKRHRK